MASKTMDNVIAIVLLVLVVGLLLEIPRGDIFDAIVRIILVVVGGSAAIRLWTRK